MKKFFLSSCVFMLAVSSLQVNAQSAYGKPKAGAGGKAATGKAATGNAAIKGGDTTKPKPGPAITPANTPVTTTAPAATAPAAIKYDTITPGGFDAKPEIALRNNYATDRSQAKDRKPLEYETCVKMIIYGVR